MTSIPPPDISLKEHWADWEDNVVTERTKNGSMARRVPWRQFPCARCKKEVVTPNKKQKYCSVSCAVMANSENKKREKELFG